MDQNITTEWSKTEKIVFRLMFCYLSCYFIFLDNFFSDFFPFIKYLHAPFQYISDAFIGFVNRLVIHNQYDKNIYTGMGDTSWIYIGIVSYFIVAALSTVIWTLFDNRKNHIKLFSYLQFYSRYYLAFVLFVYGIAKLTGEQFPEPLPDWLSQPAGNMDAHTLLWLFMGASKSYNIFGGCVEVVAGGLLLFRKTSSLGSLIAIAILTDIFIIDIAYDTLVKAILFFLILIGFYILLPDIKRVFKFFILNKSSKLNSVPRLFPQNKYSWIFYCLKFLIVGYVIFFFTKQFYEAAEAASKSYYSGLDGVYDIKEFYSNQKLLQPLDTETVRWKRIVINKYNSMSVQFMNDSIVQYTAQPDSITKTIALSLWNDNTFKSKINYSYNSTGNYVFEGLYKKDSIRFISAKVNLDRIPLLKDQGKIKWAWW